MGSLPLHRRPCPDPQDGHARRQCTRRIPMSGPSDHPLVQDYLRRLDLALAGVPQPEAAELRDQIAAHLDEALTPSSDDRTVAEVLDRLGPPEEIADEMGYPPQVAVD